MKRRLFLRQSIAATFAASLPAHALWAASLRHAPTEVTADVNAVTGDGVQEVALGVGFELPVFLQGRIDIADVNRD